jgi:hypothetical protein
MKTLKNFIKFNESLHNDLLNITTPINKYNTENKELITKLQYTITCAEKYKHSFFWHSSTSASQRRSNENKFTDLYKDYEFKYNGDNYEVKFSYSESAHNVYFSLNIYKNGSKSNITVIKNILKKLTDLKEIRKEKIKSLEKK